MSMPNVSELNSNAELAAQEENNLVKIFESLGESSDDMNDGVKSPNELAACFDNIGNNQEDVYIRFCRIGREDF